MAVTQAAVSVLVLGAMVVALLNMRKLTERASQTCNSLFAVNAVFTLMMLPLVSSLAPIVEAASKNDVELASMEIPMFLRLGVIGVSIWNLGVMGNIFRHSLNVGLGLGIGLAFCSALFVVMAVGAFGSLFV